MLKFFFDNNQKNREHFQDMKIEFQLTLLVVREMSPGRLISLLDSNLKWLARSPHLISRTGLSGDVLYSVEQRKCMFLTIE